MLKPHYYQAAMVICGIFTGAQAKYNWLKINLANKDILAVLAEKLLTCVLTQIRHSD